MGATPVVSAPGAAAEPNAPDPGKARVEIYGQVMADAIYDFKKMNPQEPEKSYLFFGGGNMMPDLGGRVIATANLTPDKETGIGDWTEEQFVKGGRADLATKEAAEAELIRHYLPEPIADDELNRLIDAAIAESGATSMKDMGAVMGRLMPALKGRAEGAVVSARVKERLG